MMAQDEVSPVRSTNRCRIDWTVVQGVVGICNDAIEHEPSKIFSKLSVLS